MIALINIQLVLVLLNKFADRSLIGPFNTILFEIKLTGKTSNFDR